MRPLSVATALSTLLLCGGVLPGPAAAEKYALLVGVDDYAPAGDSESDLASCETDALLMYHVLSTKYGFAEENIRLLLSLREGMQATGDNIITAFRDHLVRQAGPGDVVVFYFSGHGTQIEDDSGDELDRRDEALVPADVDETRQVLSDDNLDFLLDRLQTDHVTVIVDSCHAGTVTRAPPDVGRAAKSLPFDERVGELTGVKAAFPDDPPPPEPPKGEQGLPLDQIGPEVLLAACQPWETSSAYGMAFDFEGVTRRASLMTSHLYHILSSARAGANWPEVVRALRARMASSCDYEQNPALEGGDGQAVFSDRQPSPPADGPWFLTRPPDHIRVSVGGEGGARPALPDLPFVRAVPRADEADVLVAGAPDELLVAGPTLGGYLRVSDARPLARTLFALFQFRRTGMLTNPFPGFSVSLRVPEGEQLERRLGQPLTVEFESAADAYVTLFTLAPDGTVRAALTNALILADRVYRVPSPDLPRRMTFESALPQTWGGTGLVKLIACAEPVPLDEDLRGDDPGTTFLDALVAGLEASDPVVPAAERRDRISCDWWADAVAYFHVRVPEP